jgi:hypothetical protein
MPVDFVVLDMEEAPMPSSLPIILGRSFMSTVDTNISVKRGIISMEVNGEKVEFKMFDAMKLPQDNHECFKILMWPKVLLKKFVKYIALIPWSLP